MGSDFHSDSRHVQTRGSKQNNTRCPTSWTDAILTVPSDIYQRASKQGSHVAWMWLIRVWIRLGFPGFAQETREGNGEGLEHYFFFPTSWGAPWKLTWCPITFRKRCSQKLLLETQNDHENIKDVFSLPPLTLALPSCQETCLTLFHTIFSNYFTFSLTY